MDEMSNYVASGWKRDLTYIIGCCWAAQVGSLDRGVAGGHSQVPGSHGQTKGQ